MASEPALAADSGPLPLPAPLPAAAEAVLTFLESVGRRSEAELYVRLFRQLPRESFAVIAPGAPVIRQSQGAFAEQLRFLSDLGLSAPVVLGLLDPAQAAQAAERLAKRLEAASLGWVRHLPDEVAAGGEAPSSELVECLRSELCDGRFPIIELPERIGRTPTDRFAWLGRLAAELDTRKLVFLRRRGPLHLQSERALALAERHQLSVDSGSLSLVNLRTDELILGQKLLRREDAVLLELVRDLLASSGAAKLLCSITSPLDLLRELFTVRGAGTLIKRGSAVRRESSYERVDTARLGALLEASFGHQLRSDFFATEPSAVYLEEEYRAAAIVQDTAVAPYLSKFAVDPIAQGEGMGRDLWQVLVRDFPRMFWRTRADNSISAWYASVCDGMIRLADWHVFWRGIEPTSVVDLVEHALSFGDDFTR